MTNIEENRPQYDDEISLVDLATTFIRRRRVFYAAVISVLMMAVVYTFAFVDEVKEYSTLIQLGEQQGEGSYDPLEQPAAVIATIENRWYPELQSAYAETEGEKLPVSINADNPKQTTLIKLSTETSSENAGEVEEVHQQLVDKITQRQSEILVHQRNVLERRLESISGTLDRLSNRDVAGEALAQVIREQAEIRAQLESLKPAETLVVARESLENKGTSKKLILALSLVLSFMLGIFATFMAEFVAHVRQAMQNVG